MTNKTISHYTIHKKIGEGGMGKVYLATDKKLNRKVALKFLAPHLIQDDQARKRFIREAQAAATLTHPNIVIIYEIAEFKDQTFIVMEYVEGETLRDRINHRLHDRDKAPEEPTLIPLDETLDIAKQICEGLGKAHQFGIVHRDIKAENILIDPDSRVKILDFGLAKLRGSSQITQEFSKMGTVNYMSPEQVRGEAVDHRSDIWAFGVLLYEMLTGETPFKADYPQAVMYAIVHEEPRNLAGRDLPPQLVDIINTCLAKNPDDRFADIQHVLSELRVFDPRNLSSVGSHPGGKSSEQELHSRMEKESQLDSIDDLLEYRRKIDQLIEDRFTRQIAVMFCDIVGSTSFFERRGDLEGRAMLQRYNRLMFPIIKNHNGDIIKTLGDGILASFTDPAVACQAAIDMQQALKRDNESRAPEDRIQTRIGLHFGKAVIDHGDVFGDVVNATSRVESRAQPGEILVSYHLYEKVKSHADFTFKFVGKESLKGKEVQIGLYRLLWDVNEIEKEGRQAVSATPDEIATPAKPKQERETVNIIEPYRLVVPKEEPLQADDVVKNPYMNRVMIRNINEFYGRKNEVNKIYSRIGASRPQSISIVGERRIGKSSLLHYVYHPKNRQKFLKNPDQHIFIFIDFQEKRGIDLPRFFESIYESLVSEFKDGLELNVSPDYNGFKKVVSALDKQGLRLILIFDEFEIITKSQEFNTEFYSFARSIANNYNLGYIVSSGRNLQTLCHSREISDSPFFNIFSNLTLTQFSQTEAMELIIQPASKLGYSMEKYAPVILDLGGYYPFFLQMVCAAFFEYVKENRPVNRREIELIKEEVFDEAKVHFQQIWDICDEDQREVLLLLCKDASIPRSREFILKNLIRAGYVAQTEKKPQIFSSLFRDFLIDKYGAQMGISRKKKFLFWGS